MFESAIAGKVEGGIGVSLTNPIVAGALNRISQDVDMVTLRINYRFGGYGAPVAARY